MGVYDFDYPEELQADPVEQPRRASRMLPWLIGIGVFALAAAYGTWSAS